MNGVKIVLTFIFIGLFLWVSCTSICYRFIHPEKTDVQAFLHIPKSFILDFEKDREVKP